MPRRGKSVHSRAATRGCRGRNRNTRRPKAARSGAGAGGQRTDDRLARAGLTSSAFTRPGCRGGGSESPQGFAAALDSRAPAAARRSRKTLFIGFRHPIAITSWAANSQGRSRCSWLRAGWRQRRRSLYASCAESAAKIEHRRDGLLRPGWRRGSVIELAAQRIGPPPAMAPFTRHRRQGDRGDPFAAFMARLGAKGHR